MKSERRHELRTNALAQALERAPELIKEYGGKVLLGLIIVVLLVVLVVQRLHTGREQAQILAGNLAVARTQIALVRDFNIWRFGPDQMEQAALQRQQIAADGQRALDEIFRHADDARILAEAHVAQGDLHWTLATMPQIPGAEITDPELAEAPDRDTLLERAAESYRTVLDRFRDQRMAEIAARFGLAAIAENRGEWAEAEQHYRAVMDAADAPELYRRQAELRLEVLAEARAPIRLGEPRQAAGLPFPFMTEPTEQPAIELPAVDPPDPAAAGDEPPAPEVLDPPADPEMPGLQPESPGELEP